VDENMRKKLDTKLNKNKEDLKIGALIDDHNLIIYETLIHRRPT